MISSLRKNLGVLDLDGRTMGEDVGDLRLGELFGEGSDLKEVESVRGESRVRQSKGKRRRRAKGVNGRRASEEMGAKSRKIAEKERSE